MLTHDTAHLRDRIRDVPDYPKPGIVFKDITPLMQDALAMREVVSRMAAPFADQGVSQVVGIESRGFIFGAAIAFALHAGFVPVRKPGKLPAATHRCEYLLEYGSDALEIHCDALKPRERVLIVDDVLATGGTAAAVVELAGKLEADVVGLSFLIELDVLKGRDRLTGFEVASLLRY
jgi:adenine phosphoribosyltransferase